MSLSKKLRDEDMGVIRQGMAYRVKYRKTFIEGKTTAKKKRMQVTWFFLVSM